MESDPVVSSTVVEAELSQGTTPESDFKKELDFINTKRHTLCEPCDEPRKPAWRFISLDSQNGPSDNVQVAGASTNYTEFNFGNFHSDSFLADLETPEMEFDEFGLELAGDKESSPDINLFNSERMTPDGLIDEDFERELGSAVRELSVQDVIDSDFPDISRLGILQVAGDDKLGRKAILFSACRLPAADLIDHQRLLLYITKTLEQYVSSDYCLIYFHFGLTNKNKPRLGWLVQAYRTLDRNFRKNLKALYIVHPTTGIKILWSLFKPFISSKMTRKVFYVECLKNLEEYLFLNQLPIPHRVMEYDKCLTAKLATSSVQSKTNRSNIPTTLSIGPPRADLASVISGVYDDQFDESSVDPQQQFNVSLQFIKMNNGGRSIPIVLEDAVDYLREWGLDTDGIFRRSVSLKKLRDVRDAYNRGDLVDLREYDDPHLAAALLKSFLRELSEPLLTFELYDEVLGMSNYQGRAKVSAIKELVLTKLPDDNYEVLNYLMRFLTEVTLHATQNKMNASNLAVVFGPSLIWSRYQASLSAITVINAFVQILITHYESIFIK
ncbi:Rho GTPase-activating protein 1 [Paragonimus heterotremus]|uniref:Rho GTPase-activating protein 1 n=1 Tax=Paragonimus heterotremus TaxID=100268 RepID=A0A8J4SQN5_9TREM|nr:Rho GTPase-activating protein 1 [Paragonimus heterotremus]